MKDKNSQIIDQVKKHIKSTKTNESSSKNDSKDKDVVEDLMSKGRDLPIVNENTFMQNALKIITNKKLGVLIVKSKKGQVIGIITDGQIRRSSQKNKEIQNLRVKEVMTKNPISVDKDILAAKALSIMNTKKITSLCVYNKKNKSKTIGILHIHNVLENNVR